MGRTLVLVSTTQKPNSEYIKDNDTPFPKWFREVITQYKYIWGDFQVSTGKEVITDLQLMLGLCPDKPIIQLKIP